MQKFSPTTLDSMVIRSIVFFCCASVFVAVLNMLTGEGSGWAEGREGGGQCGWLTGRKIRLWWLDRQRYEAVVMLDVALEDI